MLVSPRSDFDAAATSVEGTTSNRSACDRCRGQKLRCIRDDSNQASCRRCERARTICTISPTMRMGRPVSAKNSAVRKRSAKRRHARTSTSLSAPFDSIQNTASLYSEENLQLDRPMTGRADAASDADSRESMGWLYPNNLNMDSPILASDDFGVFEPTTHFRDNSQFSSITTPPSSLQYEPPRTSLEPDSMVYTARDGSFRVESLGSRLGATVTSYSKDTEATATRDVSDSSRVIFEQISQLNMELYRQLLLEHIGAHSTPERSGAFSTAVEPVDKLPVAVMIHGLKRFEELLQSYQDAGSLNFGRDEQAHVRQLNLPTGLLIASCYLNLIRLCNMVFSNIRRCLLAVEYQAIFARLPEFQISGVILQQNQNLQIQILLQVVTSMLDHIGSSLGYPKYCSMSDQGGDERWHPSKLLTPRLMDSIISDEEYGGKSSSGRGVLALREEIRTLKEVLDRK